MKLNANQIQEVKVEHWLRKRSLLWYFYLPVIVKVIIVGVELHIETSPTPPKKKQNKTKNTLFQFLEIQEVRWLILKQKRSTSVRFASWHKHFIHKIFTPVTPPCNYFWMFQLNLSKCISYQHFFFQKFYCNYHLKMFFISFDTNCILSWYVCTRAFDILFS